MSDAFSLIVITSERLCGTAKEIAVSVSSEVYGVHRKIIRATSGILCLALASRFWRESSEHSGQRRFHAIIDRQRFYRSQKRLPLDR